MPKEDILHRLDECVDFISNALQHKENILVHCYYGVSRSSTAVIAYIMKHHDLDYATALELVKKKRRFVQPNAGFVTQLKLYSRMGCKIDRQYQKYKIYCLRLAGEQMRKAKILPQSFHNLIKADPAITQENPEPIVYRCRKCRRVLASRSHVLLHDNHTATNVARSSIVSSNINATNVGVMPRLLNEIVQQMHQTSLDSPGENEEQLKQTQLVACSNILFVEPIAWMKNITHQTQGRLNCPKCEQKVGNFSWINGCQCPCGEEISPAFYFISSKIELSKTVQNVQTTV